MNLEQFKKRFPTIHDKLILEGITLSELELSGLVESNLIGFRTTGAAPWELDPELRSLIEKEAVLKPALSTRPLFKQRLPDGSVAHATFEVGELFTSKNLKKDANDARLMKTWSLALTAAMMDALIDVLKPALSMSHVKYMWGNATDTPVTSAQKGVICDITDVPGIDGFLETWGSYMGVHARHSRNGQKGKVLLQLDDNSLSANYTSSNTGWSGKQPADTLATQFGSSPLLDACAPDCRFAAWHANKPIVGSNVFPPTQSFIEMYGFDNTIYTAVGLQAGSQNNFLLAVEIPFHDAETDTIIRSTTDFFAESFQALNGRYTNENFLNWNTKFKKNIALAVHGDIDCNLRGAVRKLSVFPESGHLNVAPLSFERFYPLVGCAPKTHVMYAGTATDKGVMVDRHAVQITRDWLAEYLSTGFGLKVKKLAASKVNADWRIDLPVNFSIYQIAEPLNLTKEEVQATNLARQYKRAREQACKTDNFMSLQYANGKSYQQIVDQVTRQGGLNVFGFYSQRAAVVAGKRETRTSRTNVTRSAYDYTCQTGSASAVVIPFSGPLATEETKANAFEYVAMAIYSGGNYPASYPTDLSIAADVVAQLDQARKVESEQTLGATIVTTPDNLSGSTGAYHTISAIERNGFLPVDFVASEQATEMKLHAAVVTSASSQSLLSILKQFQNSEYI